MNWLFSLLRIVKNNFSLIANPGFNFATVFLLTRHSHLPEDALYFFAAGLIGFMSLLDGGRAYTVQSTPSLDMRLRVLRQITLNLWTWAGPIFFGFWAAIAHSPFGDTHTLTTSAMYAMLCTCVGLVKVIVDASRVLTLRTSHRVHADQLASAMAVLRFIIGWCFLNRLPFLWIYALTLWVEVAIYFWLHDFGWRRLGWALRPRWRLKPHIYGDYLWANIGYLLGSSADRVIAYYVLPDAAYRVLVMLGSVLNMSILPHKLIENELTFPSASQSSASVASPRQPATPIPHHHHPHALKALSLFLTFIGGLAIALGLQWLAQRSAALNVTVFTQSALCLWLSATILYNRCWARQLAAGQTAALAKMTIWAGIVAVAIAGVFREQYRFLIPLAFFSYSLFNLIGVFLFHRSELRDAFGYVLATALGFCSGVFIFISF